MNLSYKILGIISFFAAIATVVVGVLSFFLTREVLEEFVGRSQVEITREAMDKIDRLLYTDYLSIKVIASTIGLSDFVIGKETVDREILAQRLMEFTFDSGPWDQLSVISATGTIVLSSEAKIEGRSIREFPRREELFRRALKEGLVYSDAFLPIDSNKITMYFAAPIQPTSRHSDSAVGVVLGSVSWLAIIDTFSDLSGEVSLFNKEGKLIATSDPESKGLVLVSLAVQGVEVPYDFSKAPYSTRALNIDTGEPTFAAVVPEKGFLSFKGNGWRLVYEVPLKEAFGSVNRDILFVAYVLISVSIVVAASVLVLIRNTVINPLTSLAHFATVVASGVFTERVSVRSKDEIGQVALALNGMADRLQETYTHLEERVKEKTEELALQVAEGEKSKRAILNLLEDVAEEKNKAEALVALRTKELADEKARLLASINSLSLGFVIVDTSNKILLRNPAIMSILDMTVEPKTIEDIAKCFGDFNLMVHCKQCIDLRGAVEIKSIEYRKKYIRVFCVPITEKGVSIGFVFLVEDITEAKVLERSRDEFFAVASHELRTPLTAIRGNSEMILEMFGDTITNKDLKEMLVDINASSLRLIDIVNDFLEVSRLEQGRFKIFKETFDIADVVKSVLRNLEGEAKKKGLVLGYDSEKEKLPLVFADKMRSEQVLVNLVGNSIKFTHAGKVTIRAELLGNFLKVQVIDTGIGVSDQNKSLLFRKFQQAGEKMLARDVTQGTGLGLYISQLIVSALGGTIGLEKSELGKGSTFTFTLPLAS